VLVGELYRGRAYSVGGALERSMRGGILKMFDVVPRYYKCGSPRATFENRFFFFYPELQTSPIPQHQRNFWIKFRSYIRITISINAVIDF